MWKTLAYFDQKGTPLNYSDNSIYTQITQIVQKGTKFIGVFIVLGRYNFEKNLRLKCAVNHMYFFLWKKPQSNGYLEILVVCIWRKMYNLTFIQIYLDFIQMWGHK